MFDDSLEMKLKLTIGKQDFDVPGANVKFIDVSVRPYGFEAVLNFWVSSETGKDKIFPEFIKPGEIRARLEIKPHIRPKGADPDPLVLQGIAVKKALLREFVLEDIKVREKPVLYRLYRINFTDPAAALWARHFPCVLLTDSSVRELLDKGKAPGAEIKYDWKALDDKHPICMLSPGGRETPVSFYDFVVWYAASNNGAFTYSAADNQYTLSEKKPQAGKAETLSGLEVEGYGIEFPSPRMHNVRLINGVVPATAPKEGKLDAAVDGVWRDIVVREPVAADFDKVFDLESGKNRDRDHDLHLVHKRFPLLTYLPDVIVEMEGGLWSKSNFLKGREYRVCDISIRAAAADEGPDADHNMPYSTYRVDMTSRLELKDEAAPNLPSFRDPVYPVCVEGTIISEQGKDEEETYQIYQDEQTKIDMLKVKLPVFDNKAVIVPFGPFFDSGHFYFTPYKNEKALIALYLHAAEIVRFLDWRADAKLPMESQGNQIVMGKGKDSKTSIDHVYSDDKPRLTITRTSSKDTEMIRLNEGTIILQTKEEES
ncbi:MAG: hypothetical protein ABFD62_10075 [Syntrophaceae bacterium]